MVCPKASLFCEARAPAEIERKRSQFDYQTRTSFKNPLYGGPFLRASETNTNVRKEETCLTRRHRIDLEVEFKLQFMFSERDRRKMKRKVRSGNGAN